MIKYPLYTSLMIASVALAGCTPSESMNNTYVPTKIINDEPHLIDVPINKNYRLTYGNDPSLERAFNQYVRTGSAPNIITYGFVKFAYSGGQQPIVKTTPFQETVISLEPGENFTNISSGDPNRWSYSVAVSGSGTNRQQNVLVKPSLPNMSTNMVITTDKRIYNLRLVSSMNFRTTKNVSFWYPDEMVESTNNTILSQENNGSVSTTPDVNLNNLNFNYRISSDRFFQSLPSWKPCRVFDDGVHTYIQFPSSIANKELPVLFILDKQDKELVNFRYKAPYFVVDKIFNRAALVMGVGEHHTQVNITNNNYS